MAAQNNSHSGVSEKREVWKKKNTFYSVNSRNYYVQR